MELKTNTPADVGSSNASFLRPLSGGTGAMSLFYSGFTSLVVKYDQGGDSKVLYGQDHAAPTIPLPFGKTTLDANRGLNLSWASSAGNFTVEWSVQ